MTRETHHVVDNHEDQGEVFSALWAAAPSFPRLPADAPEEFKRLTVNVEDPKRVYSIHHASRRHGFQILIERYITQLRHGCQDPHCTTPTCFTCRRRLAGTAPLRRYNATSARTLACFLASQDNPEKGLCGYVRSSSSKVASHGRCYEASKSTTFLSGTKDISKGIKSPKSQGNGSGSGMTIGHPIPVGAEANSTTARPMISKIIKADSEITNESADIDHVHSVVRALEQPAKKDHRSFVQNLFGTVAFRMLEWMTPASLESMISSSSQNYHSPKVENSIKPDGTGGNDYNPSSQLAHSHKENTTAELEILNLASKSATEAEPKSEFSQGPVAQASVDSNELVSDSDPPANGNTSKPNLSPNSRRRSQSRSLTDPIPPPMPRIRHMNSSTTQDIKDSMAKPGHHTGLVLQSDDPCFQKSVSPDSQGILAAKKTRKRLSSLTKPRGFKNTEEDFSNNSSSQSAAHSTTTYTPSITSTSSYSNDPLKEAESEEPVADRTQKPLQLQTASKTSLPVEAEVEHLPQSLAAIPIEVIPLFIEIFHESKRLFMLAELPPYIEERLQRTETAGNFHNNNLLGNVSWAAAGPQWQVFLQQSLFYVLSSPKALLKSFSHDSSSLMDSYTVWNSIRPLIWTNLPSAFNSLWIAAADLYIPPRELWLIYDWPKKFRMCDGDENVDYTTDEAAHLISIYLHALIANSVSPNTSYDQFEAIPRYRSHGRSVVHGRQPSDAVEVSLDSNDVISDELALRLARRVFAAIPARRQFQEILRLNSSEVPGKSSSSDVLDTVLAHFSLSDWALQQPPPPNLNDSSIDRDMYERRLPVLLIEWARTVMLQDWTGQAEVAADGSFAGALSLMSAIYDKRKAFMLGDKHFQTEYFADRLDSMEMPVQWVSFTADKKKIHLLDYAFLFSPNNLVTYFRAINFSRMSRSFEASNSMWVRVNSTVAPFMSDPNRRDELLERLKTAHAKYLVLKIRRDNVLLDAFNYLWRREERELLRPLKVRLGEDSGEEGSDSGGVQQEFFRLAIAEAFNPDYGIFTVDERSRMSWFQPGSPEPLWKFELIGLIMSLAVYNGLTLPITFPRALYRKILGVSNTELHHIEDGWPDLASGLTALLEWDEKNGSVSDVFSRTYEFTIELFGKQVSRDMAAGTKWPQFHEPSSSNPVDARLVDSENRNEYVNDYTLWLTDISVRPQFEAFRKGFLTCLDRRSLSLFDPETLQAVVEGVQEIDILELRHYTRYVGWDANHRTIRDFWSIAKKFNTDEKKKLLEFVTASDRVPVGGMQNLTFVIQRNGVGDIDGHLPTSYTCYGTLLLPEYSSKDILREKILMALENAKGFGFA